MRHRLWLWRTLFAALGTGGYWLLHRPDWSNPFLTLYDVPTLLLAFSYAGAILGDLCRGASSAHVVRLVGLFCVLVFADGAEYWAWPISGHLTVAVTVGLMEAGDALNPRWLRWSALLPSVLLVLVRTFWPQSELMGIWLNTVTALFVGGLLGAIGLRLLTKTTLGNLPRGTR